MKLYHYTTLQVACGKNVKPGNSRITLTKLRPGRKQLPELPAAVWLTADPEPGTTETGGTYVRFEVEIPDGDPKLVGPPAEFVDLDPRAIAWRAYLGTIPAAWFTGAELIRFHPWFFE